MQELKKTMSELDINDAAYNFIATSMKQCLTFFLTDDEYGVDILAVQEINSWTEPRPIPNTPEYIKGVIDWRNTVVPIVDLRMRFNYKNIEYKKTTVVIILKSYIHALDQDVTVGIVVDSVSDVLDLNEEIIRDKPHLGDHVETKYIKGLVKNNNKMVVLLDLQQLIDLQQLETKLLP